MRIEGGGEGYGIKTNGLGRTGAQQLTKQPSPPYPPPALTLGRRSCVVQRRCMEGGGLGERCISGVVSFGGGEGDGVVEGPGWGVRSEFLNPALTSR